MSRTWACGLVYHLAARKNEASLQGGVDVPLISRAVACFRGGVTAKSHVGIEESRPQ